VEELDEVLFIGVNFYSSVKNHTYLEDMSKSATKNGLDKFIYPPHDPR